LKGGRKKRGPGVQSGQTVLLLKDAPTSGKKVAAQMISEKGEREIARIISGHHLKVRITTLRKGEQGKEDGLTRGTNNCQRRAPSSG